MTPPAGYTPREDALARLVADLFRTDLEAAIWLAAQVQPSVRDLCPSPRGLGPLPWARLWVGTLDRETVAPTSRLWALLSEGSPFRRADIERVRDMP